MAVTAKRKSCFMPIDVDRSRTSLCTTHGTLFKPREKRAVGLCKTISGFGGRPRSKRWEGGGRGGGAEGVRLDRTMVAWEKICEMEMMGGRKERREIGGRSVR